jgi:hypothetical protein
VHGVRGQPPTPHLPQLLLGHGVVVPQRREDELRAESLPQEVRQILQELQLDAFVELAGVVREGVPANKAIFYSKRQSRDYGFTRPLGSIILTISLDVSQIEYLSRAEFGPERRGGVTAALVCLISLEVAAAGDANVKTTSE